jgi:hypothetical protein
MKNIISISILFAGVLAMIFPAHAVSGQIFLTNEIPNFAPIQQGPQQQQIDPRFMSFEQFMQYMFYYEKMFGKDYVTKIYKEYHNDDDDDDDDRDKKDNKKRDKDWWKHNSKDKDWWKEHKDKKKYCEGKGSWNGKKCVTDNDEDRTAHEDAVCDDGKKSKFCGNANKDRDDKDEKDEDDRGISEDEIEDSLDAIEDVSKDEDAEEEQDEPEEEDDEEEEEDDSDDDDSDDDDSGGDEGDEE